MSSNNHIPKNSTASRLLLNMTGFQAMEFARGMALTSTNPVMAEEYANAAAQLEKLAALA